MKTLYRLLLFSTILSLPFSCKKENKKIEIPQWLDEMIQERENEPLYFSASVYRYQWENLFIYEFEIPLSSCMYCEVYTSNGELVSWVEYNFDNYLEQRTDKTLIWHNPDRFD
jgi:hypothetical protein